MSDKSDEILSKKACIFRLFYSTKVLLVLLNYVKKKDKMNFGASQMSKRLKNV